MLRALSWILASRHSATKDHPWTEKKLKQSTLISSSHSFQETTHQVNTSAQFLFGRVLLVTSSGTLPMSLSLSSFQILAVSPPAQVVRSGYRQTLVTSLPLQRCRICKSSMPTSPAWVANEIIEFCPSLTESYWLWVWKYCCLIGYWIPFAGRVVVVTAHSCSSGTANAKLPGLEWHRKNRSCVWAPPGGQCSGKCGWIPDRAGSKWTGWLHSLH